MNSAATLKAFCRRARRHRLHLVATRRAVLEWAFERGREGALLPRPAPGPQHRRCRWAIPLDDDGGLGPAAALGGIDRGEVGARPAPPLEGPLLGPRALHRRPDRRRRAREYPGVNVVVHPECTLRGGAGRRLQRLDRVHHQGHRASAGRQRWAVGTEINLVSRLAQSTRTRRIFCLDPVVCPCSTMYRIHPAYLLWVLDNLLDGRVVNQVIVPEAIRHWAKVALDRMLALA